MTLDQLRDYIRPIANAVLIGFIVASAIAAGAMEAMEPGLGVRYTLGMGGALKAIPAEFYALAGAGLVTYTAAREAGKAMTTWTRHRARVDDPDGESE